MSNTSEKYYSIKKRYSVVVHEADRIEFRQGAWNPTSITLTDESGSGKLASTVDLLDGAHSIDAIASLTVQSIDDVRAIIDHLVLKEVVSLQADNYLDQYIDVIQGRRAPIAVFDGPVVIAGPPEIAEPLRTGLARTVPALRVTIADKEHPLSTIDHQDTTWLEDGLDFHRNARRFEDLRGAFVIYAESVADPVKTRIVDRVLHHLGTPWLYGVVDGPFVLVGPTTVPGRTPSWDAYETRMLMNLRESASYQGYKRALAEGRVRRDKDYEVQPVLAQLLAAHLLPEAASWVTTGTAGTLSHAYTFFAPTSEFAVHEILPLPDSTVGMPVAERDDFELYFGTRTLEEIAE